MLNLFNFIDKEEINIKPYLTAKCKVLWSRRPSQLDSIIKRDKSGSTLMSDSGNNANIALKFNPPKSSNELEIKNAIKTQLQFRKAIGQLQDTEITK